MNFTNFTNFMDFTNWLKLLKLKLFTKGFSFFSECVD